MNGTQLESLETLIHIFRHTPHIKSNSWLQFPEHEITFTRKKLNIMVNLDILLAGYSPFIL